MNLKCVIVINPPTAQLLAAAFPDWSVTVDTDSGPFLAISADTAAADSHGFVIAQRHGETIRLNPQSVVAIWEGETAKAPPGFLSRAAGPR